VTPIFSTPDRPVTWVFARGLLQAGLSTRNGEGDVIVWADPGDGFYHMRAASPSA
jgi:hypothetical protein